MTAAVDAPSESECEIEIDHAGASVAELDRSLRFYADAFGFRVDESFTIPGTAVTGMVLVHPGGARVELFCHPDSVSTGSGDPIESVRQRGWFQLAFRVVDVATVFARAVAAGGTAVRAPFVAPDARSLVAFVGDPDGHLVELIQRRAPE